MDVIARQLFARLIASAEVRANRARKRRRERVVKRATRIPHLRPPAGPTFRVIIVCH